MSYADGTLWVGGRGGLIARTTNGWRKAEHPAGGISSGYTDGAHLIVSGVDGVFMWDPTRKRFEQTAKVERAPQAIAIDAAGKTWVTDPVAGFRVLGQELADPSIRGRGIRLLRDHSGNLWIGTLGQGLWFIPPSGRAHDGAVEPTASLTGLLSDDGVLSLTEDRDGDIWVGLTEGLVRLIKHNIAQITDAGMVTNLAAHQNGDV
jgi:ligand-binding sensor domain-containing protein